MIEQPYRLSFTATTLRVEETFLLAQFMGDHADKEEVVEIPGNLFGNLKQSTHNRMVRELRCRLDNLSDNARTLLVNGTYSQRKNMCYLAVLKTYPFIRHFVKTVLIANHEVFKTSVEEWQYRDFLNSEELKYAELRRISGESLKKLKRNMFTILTEAEVLSGKPERRINPIYPGEAEKIVLDQEDLNWISYFTLRTD